MFFIDSFNFTMSSKTSFSITSSQEDLEFFQTSDSDKTKAKHKRKQVRFVYPYPLHFNEIHFYYCNDCLESFKRLNAFLVHFQYFKNHSVCPTTRQSVKLGLRKISHCANGVIEDCWEVPPPVVKLFKKDEVLQALDDFCTPFRNGFDNL